MMKLTISIAALVALNASPALGGKFQLKHVRSGKCLGFTSSANNSPARQLDCSSAQKFEFYKSNYHIKIVEGLGYDKNLCIDAYLNPIVIYTCGDYDEQQALPTKVYDRENTFIFSFGGEAGQLDDYGSTYFWLESGVMSLAKWWQVDKVHLGL